MLRYPVLQQSTTPYRHVLLPALTSHNAHIPYPRCDMKRKY
jgi:hypothetical protein